MTEPEQKLHDMIMEAKAQRDAQWGLFDALPILNRLRLSDRDKANIAAFATANPSRWCGILEAVESALALLPPGTIPPEYMLLIAAIAAALCPNPPTSTPADDQA